MENVVPAGRVAASPICLASNDVPDVFRVEPQESHDVVSPNRHEDSDFCIEKPLENVVPAGRVAASPVCMASNDVPDVFRVEPHVAEVSKDVAVDQTVVNPENVDVATEGQSSGFVAT